MLPKALKSYPKSNKSPNLATLNGAERHEDILRERNREKSKFVARAFVEGNFIPMVRRQASKRERKREREQVNSGVR